jgi:hypothetical protein
MLGAAVPETAVYEDGYAGAWEYDVRFATQPRNRAAMLEEPKSRAV